MKIAWLINLIGLILSIIGFTKLGSNLFLITGLTIQTIAVITYYVIRYGNKNKDNNK